MLAAPVELVGELAGNSLHERPHRRRCSTSQYRRGCHRKRIAGKLRQAVFALDGPTWAKPREGIFRSAAQEVSGEGVIGQRADHWASTAADPRATPEIGLSVASRKVGQELRHHQVTD